MNLFRESPNWRRGGEQGTHPPATPMARARMFNDTAEATVIKCMEKTLTKRT